MKSIPLDKELWDKTKKDVENMYSKWSAFASGRLVQLYKQRGGKFSQKVPKSKTDLSRWFLEQWQDIGNKNYPVFRPTKRINKKTPLLASEIDPKNLKKQIEKKQKIRGTANLEPFQKKSNIL